MIDYYKNNDYSLDVDENFCIVEWVLFSGEIEKGEGEVLSF